jgi:hypothetical protein
MAPEVFHHYKTGVDCLDNGHWAILQKLNEAIAMSTNGSADNIATILAETVDLVVYELARNWLVL